MDNSNYAPPHWSHWKNAFFTNYVEEDTVVVCCADVRGHRISGQEHRARCRQQRQAGRGQSVVMAGWNAACLCFSFQDGRDETFHYICCSSKKCHYICYRLFCLLGQKAGVKHRHQIVAMCYCFQIALYGCYCSFNCFEISLFQVRWHPPAVRINELLLYQTEKGQHKEIRNKKVKNKIRGGGGSTYSGDPKKYCG